MLKFKPRNRFPKKNQHFDIKEKLTNLMSKINFNINGKKGKDDTTRLL